MPHVLILLVVMNALVITDMKATARNVPLSITAILDFTTVMPMPLVAQMDLISVVHVMLDIVETVSTALITTNVLMAVLFVM
jgi:hypothetical protein